MKYKAVVLLLSTRITTTTTTTTRLSEKVTHNEIMDGAMKQKQQTCNHVIKCTKYDMYGKT